MSYTKKCPIFEKFQCSTSDKNMLVKSPKMVLQTFIFLSLCWLSKETILDLMLHNNESKTHWILCILSWYCTASDPVYTKTEPVRSTPFTIVQHVHCRYNFRLWVSVAKLTMLGDVHKRQQKQSKLERHSWQTYLNKRQKCNQFYLCLLRWVLLQFLLRAQPLNETPKFSSK